MEDVIVGDENPGDENPGDENLGDENLGDENPGDENPGNENPGDENLGDENLGDENLGDENLGDSDKSKKEEADWMKEDDDQTLSDVMPVSAHIRAKRKLKGRIGEKDTEIEKLRKENEDLKNQKLAVLPKDKTLIRPRQDNYESFDDYQTALDDYEDERLDSKLSVVQGRRQLRETQTKAVEKLNKAVDEHYLRADKLVKDSGISAETYKQADEIVRGAIETIRPGQGDIVVDQVISLLGKGSEKVIYKLGRSKALRGELITLLTEDPHGLRATAFLGEQKAKLLGTTKRRSTAPAPTSELNGDASSSNKERVFRKKYDSAHVKGNSQAAYNAKKEARAVGVNTSKW